MFHVMLDPVYLAVFLKTFLALDLRRALDIPIICFPLK